MLLDWLRWPGPPWEPRTAVSPSCFRVEISTGFSSLLALSNHKTSPLKIPEKLLITICMQLSAQQTDHLVSQSMKSHKIITPCWGHENKWTNQKANYKIFLMSQTYFQSHWESWMFRMYLSVLCEVMVQQLRVGLLVRWQDVKEGSRGITRSTSRVQGPSSPQCWRQAERRRCPCVEALLVKWLTETERQWLKSQIQVSSN